MPQMPSWLSPGLLVGVIAGLLVAPLAAEVEAASDDRVADVGVEWARQQATELMDAGVPGIHFYIMSTARHVVRVAEPLQKLV